MTHQEIGIYEINRISYLGKGYMYWVDTCLFLSIEWSLKLKRSLKE